MVNVPNIPQKDVQDDKKQEKQTVEIKQSHANGHTWYGEGKWLTDWP
jgi:hypothetical protein